MQKSLQINAADKDQQYLASEPWTHKLAKKIEINKQKKSEMPLPNFDT